MSTDAQRAHYLALIEAIKNDQTCLAECYNPVTGETIFLVCFLRETGEEAEIVPMAIMFNGEDMESLQPITIH
jgi:hypothetical protein